METSPHLSDGLRVRRPGRSRIDGDALQALARLELAIRLLDRVTENDRNLVLALLATGTVSAAAAGGSRSYASRRVHQVLLPLAEALAELGKLDAEGGCLGVLERMAESGNSGSEDGGGE